MNNSLERLTEGIIATLRTHVIPHVTDAYARGQAIGVIDILNNIAPRLEWARQPIIEAVLNRRRAIRAVVALAAEAPARPEALADGALALLGSAALLAERDRLDGEIADLMAWASGAGGGAEAALALLRRHVHDELTVEMKTTRKPLFAEIAGGPGATPA